MVFETARRGWKKGLAVQQSLNVGISSPEHEKRDMKEPVKIATTQSWGFWISWTFSHIRGVVASTQGIRSI